MKYLIRKLFNLLGYDIVKSLQKNECNSPYSTLLQQIESVDLENLVSIAQQIPGMIELRSGQILYLLCYMQDMKGDVVEIGSWLGRSSVFLASAVKESKNGKFFAVDHFHGNQGKESLYTQRGELIDIKQQYVQNLEKVGLMSLVTLLDMPSSEAANVVKGNTIRFLFIDGDHSLEGVENDVKLFIPMLKSGSIIVFDDFSDNFPGVIEVVKGLFSQVKVMKSFAYKNTFVVLL